MSHAPGRSGSSRRVGRSASRPAAARRSVPPGSARRAPLPIRKRFTGRAVVLGLLFIALMLAYAYPVRIYLTQNAEMSRLSGHLEVQRHRIDTLAAQNKKWEDPAYFAQQARERLQLVLPGDTAYRVADPTRTDEAMADQAKRGRATSEGSWYGKLWSSTQAADQPVEKRN